MPGIPEALAPDRILLHGQVHTCDDAKPEATAVAIRDGRFIAVGDDDEIGGLAGSTTRVDDLGGATVVPGLAEEIDRVLPTATMLGGEWVYQAEMAGSESRMAAIGGA